MPLPAKGRYRTDQRKVHWYFLGRCSSLRGRGTKLYPPEDLSRSRRDSKSATKRYRSFSRSYVEIIFFSTPTPAATARSYSSGTVAESWRAMPVESKTV